MFDKIMSKKILKLTSESGFARLLLERALIANAGKTEVMKLRKNYERLRALYSQALEERADNTEAELLKLKQDSALAQVAREQVKKTVWEALKP